MAMALGILGGVVSAVGSLASASAQANAAKFNAAVARDNRLAVLDQTSAEVEDKRKKNRQLLGAMRAAYGANGLEMSGSPLDVVSDTTAEMEYDVAKMRYVGKMKAVGYANQAKLFDMEAKSAKTAGFIGAASGLLGAFQGMGGGGSMFGTEAQTHPLYG